MKVRTLIRKALLAALLPGGLWSAITQADIPSSPDAASKGVFGLAINWLIIPIHMTLLPDGRVLSFGTDAKGFQGALVHDIWNPALGNGLPSHKVLPNTVTTNLFCAAQTLVPSSGEALITGGDIIKTGVVNNGVADTNFFDYMTDKMRPGLAMSASRWYPTMITTGLGDIVILGGRDLKLGTNAAPVYAPTPEIYSESTQTLKALPGAYNVDAYATTLGQNWFYPRGYLAPDGKIFIITHNGAYYWLNPTGNGTITKVTNAKAILGNPSLPSVMYRPGKIFSLRNIEHLPSTTPKTFDTKVQLIDFTNPSAVTAKFTNGIVTGSNRRIWANTTLLANGKVFINGGSDKMNELVGVAHESEIWDPDTDQWQLAAANNANLARLYHSTALLLPDATVLTGGGGAPGPQKNMNAEVYYPPYLYNSDGTPAARPAITSAPAKIVWNSSFEVAYNSLTPITKVAFVRAGSTTHSFNNDQRYQALNFTQLNQKTITVTGPTDRNISPPGFYMLFIFDKNGVPSVAKMMHLS